VAWVVVCACAAGFFGGCKGKGKSKKKAGADDGGVPAPLKNPARFCFATCARKVQCRLGEGEGDEQRKILRAEMERCSRNCLQWIKGHPYDAVALHLCYAKKSCNDLVSCLGQAQRLMKDSADPQKKRQCFKLCVDFGQCEGNERACLRACTAGDLRVYRALTKCENRGCPQVKECVEGHMKQKVVP
jgi:hypothetical protein